MWQLFRPQQKAKTVQEMPKAELDNATGSANGQHATGEVQPDEPLRIR
jgi:hypothetical protein